MGHPRSWSTLNPHSRPPTGPASHRKVTGSNPVSPTPSHKGLCVAEWIRQHHCLTICLTTPARGPCHLRLQQSWLLSLPRQPRPLRRRRLGQPHSCRGCDRGRFGLSGVVRVGAVLAASEELDRTDADHRIGDRPAADPRNGDDARDRGDQPRHDRGLPGEDRFVAPSSPP